VESEAGVRTLAFASRDLTGWDTSLLTFLARVQEICTDKGIQLNSDGLPEGVRRLLAGEERNEPRDGRSSKSLCPATTIR
jgi:phospholipid/cholesterol/gamma-HCH transport system permease protein